MPRGNSVAPHRFPAELGSRSSLVSGNPTRQVSDDLGSLLHGEMDLIQVIEHSLHLLGLAMQGLSGLGSNLNGVLYYLRKQLLGSGLPMSVTCGDPGHVAKMRLVCS